MMRWRLERRASPVSVLLIVTDQDGALRALEFGDHETRMLKHLRERHGNHEVREGAAPNAVARALDDYFEGRLDALADLPVQTGGTPFQRAVWQALRTIPGGATASYGQIAARIGRPGASRAVGAANGANPVAIVIPCHRVIGADGTLTGYGGGIKRKEWLLGHERKHSVRTDQLDLLDT